MASDQPIGEAGREARTARADARAPNWRLIIAGLRAVGVTTLKGITAALNARGIATPTGRGTWRASQVHRVLARVKG